MWLEVLYWIDHVWSFHRNVCVVPVVPSEASRCSLPYVLFVFFCMSEVISSFRSFEKLDRRCFAVLMLFSFV